MTLGFALEQVVEGDTRSFNLAYIDWIRPERNAFHASLEFCGELILLYRYIMAGRGINPYYIAYWLDALVLVGLCAGIAGYILCWL